MAVPENGLEAGPEDGGVDPAVIAALLVLVQEAREAAPQRMAVIGICGAQGSGKSTVSEALAAHLRAAGHVVEVLSIDDIYLTHAERGELARTLHPLLATRGVPGTHDVALGIATIAALARGEAVSLPRFDKSMDDRMKEICWPSASPACEVLILEGWCVGARQQEVGELSEPVNSLEAEEDANGTWRGYVNGQLARAYQALFARIDRLVLLAAPGFEVVFDWRMQQERQLARLAGPDAPAVMDEAQVARFIGHYERLTRHILTEMPRRADLVVRLGAGREVLALELNQAD